MDQGSDGREEPQRSRREDDPSACEQRDGEPATETDPVPEQRTGFVWPAWGRTIEVDGEPRPVASLLRRGAALAVDLCFAVLAAALALNALSYLVPLDTDRATGPILAVFGVLAVHILWLRDRGATHPGRGLRHGLSVGRWLLGLRLVPVRGARRFVRPVTVADGTDGTGETARIIRAVLLGVAASLVAMLLLGHAVSRTVVFATVDGYVEEHPPFAAERGGSPELASLPSALVVGRSRAYVRVDATWAASDDALEFFLERDAAGWEVTSVRIATAFALPNYGLAASDAEVPVP